MCRHRSLNARALRQQEHDGCRERWLNYDQIKMLVDVVLRETRSPASTRTAADAVAASPTPTQSIYAR